MDKRDIRDSLRDVTEPLRPLVYTMTELEGKLLEVKRDIQETIISNPGLRERYMTIDWARVRRDNR